MITKRGKRNQSSLIAHDGLIRAARSQNPPVSYVKICEELLAKHDLKIAPSTVFNYVKVRSKKRSYFTMLPLESPAVSNPAELDQDTIRRAQWEEKRRVDKACAESEAYLKAQSIIEKRTFTFDPSKPLELIKPKS